jgi:NADH dehydrogenase
LTLPEASPRVLIVGGGFAGVACARHLASHSGVSITLVDQNNYSQFLPLLYQVATSQLGSGDIASPLRTLELRHAAVHIRLGEVASIDPLEHDVTLVTGERLDGDILVLAAGTRVNFLNVPGAAEHAFPLYSLQDAMRLRSRIIAAFEEAERDPSVIDKGALTFVIVGGGATGTEMAGALSEMIHGTLTSEFRDLAVSRAKVILIDHGHAILGPFTDSAHDYAAKVLTRDGVQLRFGTGVTEVGSGHVTLSDGTVIPTRCVVWGGGVAASALATEAGLPVGRGGRVVVNPDLTVEGFPGVYAVGDIAQIPAADGSPLPQLGSVAQQSGVWAAQNIVLDLEGKQRRPFHYKDKGIMAMIGRNSSVAEVGPHRHELHGSVAFAAWLGVHVALLSGFRNRVDAFVDWGWDYFSKARSAEILDRTDEARIDWGDDEVVELSTAGAAEAADLSPTDAEVAAPQKPPEPRPESSADSSESEATTAAQPPA